jgi:hypothetical protein
MQLVVSILSNLLNKDNYVKKVTFFLIFESEHLNFNPPPPILFYLLSLLFPV